jgi:HK97 family phage major capsid protein
MTAAQTEIRAINGSPLVERTLRMDAAGADGDARRIELSFSSEAPYERWWGIEILDHDPSSVRMDRLSGGGHPLLLQHDGDRQVGVIESARIDEDRKGRAVARFGKGALATEVWQDVHDNIRSLVSVGYIIHRAKLIESDGERELTGAELMQRMASPGRRDAGDGKPPVYRVIDWEPYEASIVSIPADTSVGVGRAAAIETQAAAPAETKPERIITMTTESTPTIDPAALERARVKEIVDIGEAYSPKYITPRDIADACRNGTSVDKFRDLVMAKMASRHSDTSDAHIGMTESEIKRYSFGRALVAQMSGDWSEAGLELEASRAVAKMWGKAPEGFFVPVDYLARRDFNVGTGSEAGNLVATDLRPDMWVDVFRNALVTAQLGIRILPGLTSSIDLPRKATAGTLGMLTEIGSASEANPTTAKTTLSPKRIGAYTEVSKQALIQSALSLEEMIKDDLVTGAAVLLENQILNGAGTGAEIKGIRNVSGIGTYAYGTAGGALSWDGVVGLESACSDVNAEPDLRSGYLVNTKTRGKAKRTAKSTYMSWIWDMGGQPLNGYRAAVTNNLPSNLTKGSNTTVCSSMLFASDWSMGVIGLFGSPDVTVDPYTKASTGQVVITLNQFADFGTRQPAAFAKDDDVLTT